MIKYLFIILLFFLLGCKSSDINYFPVDKLKRWSYAITITPEIDKPTTYKKINVALGKTKINKEIYYPLLRENGSVYYYQKKNSGIFRYGFSFEKEREINLHKKERLVLPKNLETGTKWNVNSKTYLILKRYPYYDYRATTNFQINYEVVSKNQTVTTPLGKFKDCLYLRGVGNTKFIGDSEIGSIDINIISEEWYAKNVGLIKSIRTEKTNSDLFGTTKMVQTLESYE